MIKYGNVKKKFGHAKEFTQLFVMFDLNKNMFLLSRLVGTIFKLLAKEKLGYEISLVDGQEEPTASDSDLSFSFKKLSSCGNEL